LQTSENKALASARGGAGGRMSVELSTHATEKRRMERAPSLHGRTAFFPFLLGYVFIVRQLM
jgi:hypothetical protein